MSMKLIASASRKVRKLHITSCTVITWSDVACSLQSRNNKIKKGGHIYTLQHPRKQARHGRALSACGTETHTKLDIHPNAKRRKQAWQDKTQGLSTVCVGGGDTHVMHARGGMTIDPRTPEMPGRSTSSFHRLGRHCLHIARNEEGGLAGSTPSTPILPNSLFPNGSVSLAKSVQRLGAEPAMTM